MYSYLRRFVTTNPHALKRTLSGIGPKYYKPLRNDGMWCCTWWGSGVVAGWTLSYIYCKDDYPPPPPLFNFV